MTAISQQILSTGKQYMNEKLYTTSVSIVQLAYQCTLYLGILGAGVKTYLLLNANTQQ